MQINKNYTVLEQFRVNQINIIFKEIHKILFIQCNCCDNFDITLF